MGWCEEGDCKKPAGIEVLTHDDTYEMLCEEHAEQYRIMPVAPEKGNRSA